MSNQHVLKIHPAPLADLLSGAKTAEVRRNDRGFQVGDTVALREVNPFNDVWTGRPYPVRTISHIQTGYGLPEGVCVLSYAQADQQEAQYETLEDILNSPMGPCDEEAQDAQAGDERAAFERNPAFVGMDFSRAEGHGEYYDSPFANGAWEGWRARAALATQPAAGTTSDQYRAELYDEVWQNARSMGYGNVTDALSELERFKLAQAAAGKPAAVVEQTDYPYPVSSQIDVPLPVGTQLYTVQPAAVRGAEHE